MSKRTKTGAPRSVARRSRQATTPSASMERSTSLARASRVNSSMTLRILSIRPSLVWSNWKSRTHTTFGRIGQNGPMARPMPRSGFLRLR
jgi:hypothetical protein